MATGASAQFEGTGPEQEFHDHLRVGKFMIQRCVSSGKHVFYPRVMEPGSGKADLEWVEASGKGTVYSTTIVRRLPERGGDYNVALIDLQEGPRMMSRVVDVPPDGVTIGLAVEARIDDFDGVPTVVFTPAG